MPSAIEFARVAIRLYSVSRTASLISCLAFYFRFAAIAAFRCSAVGKETCPMDGSQSAEAEIGKTAANQLRVRRARMLEEQQRSG
jgi:hypothetical protein